MTKPTVHDIVYEKRIKVIIDDMEAFRNYFLEGTWKDAFWNFDSVEEVVETLSGIYIESLSEYDFDLVGFKKDVEGFGYYINNDTSRPNAWVSCEMTTKAIGTKITIIDNELFGSDVTRSYELNGEEDKHGL